jgi:hypothetical protein
MSCARFALLAHSISRNKTRLRLHPGIAWDSNGESLGEARSLIGCPRAGFQRVGDRSATVLGRAKWGALAIAVKHYRLIVVNRKSLLTRGHYKPAGVVWAKGRELGIAMTCCPEGFPRHASRGRPKRTGGPL